MIKKVITFAASPRRNGNTETLLDSLNEGLVSRDVEVVKYRTQELDIHSCIGCGLCEKLGECVINDSFGEIFRELSECDGVVFSSPLYFMNTPASAKALIDRCQVFWAARYKLNTDLFGGRKRFGFLAACSGSRYGPGKSDIFRGISDTMTYFFKSLGIDSFNTLFFSNVDEKGAISRVEGALKKAFDAGVLLGDELNET
jgi:multimeric flavodoxin WrbA